jgi:hypothetical protein
VLATPRASLGQAACIGDCNGNGQVNITDLVLGVNIALGLRPLSACPAFDDGSGNVTIAVLVTAVNNRSTDVPRRRPPRGRTPPR